MEGHVKFFNKKKGWGFITTDQNRDYFVHHTDINGDGFQVLNEGEKITFDIEANEKGTKAVNVIPVK